MVDVTPVNRMPPELHRYWTRGKGAAKIRWGVPGDFLRCVRQIRKYFPKDPKGLCANLHHDALGKWPGRERLAFEEKYAKALLAAAPMGELQWIAPLAPINAHTGDGRWFLAGALTFRQFPLPLSWIKAETGGHSGRMTVGRIMGAFIGPDEKGREYAWGFGDFFSPADIPEVSQALTLVRGGVSGLSLDPGGHIRVRYDTEHQDDGGRPGHAFTSYKAGGATLVSIPAFEGQYMALIGPDDVFEDDDDTDEMLMMADFMDDDEQYQEGNGVTAAGDCGCEEFAVNPSGWRGMPLAPRNTSVDKDDAARRIAAWAGGDSGKLNRMFLWRHDKGDPASVHSYRLPVGDIIDGRPTLIYHAIYAASALLEGAHGGLPNIPDSEKDRLRRVISAIYKKISADFDDPDIKASWDREVKRDNGVTPVEKKAGDSGDFASGDDMALTELAAEILVGEEEEVVTSRPVEETLVASGPLTPPAKWFDKQNVLKTPGITISEEGRVQGYLASWKQCHMSVGRGKCVRAPRTRTDYQYFHLGSVTADNGDLIKVGRLTVGGGHADVSLGVIPATEHYDNAGATVAVVRAYEDAYGIQVAGAIVAGATPQQVAMLRRSPLSGDWRAVNGNLELVAALAVNVPGFPVFAEDEEGHEMALISAGFVEDEEEGHSDFDHLEVVKMTQAPCDAGGWPEDEEFVVDADEIVTKVVSALDERQAAKDRAAALQVEQEFQKRTAQDRRAEVLRNIVGVK